MWVTWPLVAPGSWVTAFDTVAYSGPNLQITSEAVRQGRLAQWNDAIYGGIGHVANMHSAALYPLKWPFAWMEVHRAWVYLVAVHVVVLGTGMFWLIRRRLGLLPPAAALATVITVGSGAVMIRMLFFEQILVLAWAPWLLGTIDAVIRADGVHRGRAIAAAAVVSGLTLTAGHAQLVYLLIVVCAVWSIGRALDQRRPARIAAVAAAAGLGVALAAPQLLTAAALASRSANTQGRDANTLANPGYSVQIRRLAGTWLGDPLAEVHSVTSAGYENLTFVGVIASVLSLCGLAVLWRERRRWTAGALAGLLFGSLVLGIGPRLVVYRVAFRLIPGFSQARVPARWTLAGVLAAAVLAGVGVDGLRRGVLPLTWRRALVGVVLVAGVAIVVLPFDNPPAATLLLWAALALVGVGVCLAGTKGMAPMLVVVLLAGTIELGLANRHSAARASRAPQPYTAVGSVVLDWLARQPERTFALTPDRVDDNGYVARSLRPNTNVTVGIRTVDGYDGGIQVTAAWVETWQPLAKATVQPDAPIRNQLALPLEPDALAALAVRWLLIDTEAVDPAVAAPGWLGPVLSEAALVVYENPAFRGETWWAAPVDPSHRIDVDSPEIQRVHPGRLRVRIEAAAPGRLVVAEQWDPGWSATLDGRKVAVQHAGPLFLAIEVTEGTHRLELRYRSPGLDVGLALFAFALCLVLALLAERGPSRGRLLRPPQV